MNDVDVSKSISEKYVQLLNEKDEAAFAYFYNLYINDLYAYGLGLGGSKDNVKDIIQDVFINLHFAKYQFETASHLKFYLLKSVKNKLYDIFRSAKPTQSLDESELDFSIKVSFKDDLLEKEEQEIIAHKTERILSVLTNRQREAIYLRFIQELDYEEIAQILDMTVPAARKLVARSMKRMREDQNLATFLLIILFFL